MNGSGSAVPAVLATCVCLALGTSGCGCRPDSPKHPASPSTSLADLRRLVELPVVPVHVIWQTFEVANDRPRGVPGSGRWMLVASLEYDDESEVERVLAELHNPHPQPLPKWSGLTWLPPAALEMLHEATSETRSPDLGVFEATPFYRTPLIHGHAVVSKPHKCVLLLLDTK